MSVVAKGLRWAGRNVAPLVLLPLAAVLVWVALWRVWLPPAGGHGAVTRTVTTVDLNTPTTPTHKVTTVVRLGKSAVPSRRSEVLTLALVLLGAAAALVGVFHDRIGSIQLGKDGVKIDLSPAEAAGAAALAGRLAAQGAPPPAYGRGFDRYLRALASRRAGRPALAGATPAVQTDAQAIELADRIADETV